MPPPIPSTSTSSSTASARTAASTPMGRPSIPRGARWPRSTCVAWRMWISSRSRCGSSTAARFELTCGIRPTGRGSLAATVASVSNEEFEALVGRLEGEAKRNPGGYKARVVLIALLGNAYLGLMLLAVTALLLAAIVSIAWLKGAGVKIAIVVGVFLWMVLKALWIRL